MPKDIIKKFQDKYGKEKGKRIYYATAQAQGRDPETFKKESIESRLDMIIEDTMEWGPLDSRDIIDIDPNDLRRDDPTISGEAMMYLLDMHGYDEEDLDRIMSVMDRKARRGEGYSAAKVLEIISPTQYA